jgi:hypothetical protein
MYHERLNHMKETLMCAVEMQLCDLEEADTKELGEVIDMIKDLEEAIYYCTVTEAMNSPKMEMEFEMEKGEHHRDKGEGNRMYYDGGYAYNGMRPMNGHKMGHDGVGGQNSHDRDVWRDEREGRSYNSRKMYMEAREMNKDKAQQLKELEKYMQELSQDVTEMIAEASPEEKQYLEKKISSLAVKVGQMK